MTVDATDVLTSIATVTDSATSTVTEVVADYPQCAPSNSIGGYNGKGIEVLEVFYASSAAASSAYDCCVRCVTSSSCAAASYNVNGVCTLVTLPIPCSPANVIGYYLTSSYVASGSDLVLYLGLDNSCGMIVFGGNDND